LKQNPSIRALAALGEMSGWGGQDKGGERVVEWVGKERGEARRGVSEVGGSWCQNESSHGELSNDEMRTIANSDADCSALCV
jgi:hypothetical protein